MFSTALPAIPLYRVPNFLPFSVGMLSRVPPRDDSFRRARIHDKVDCVSLVFDPGAVQGLCFHPFEQREAGLPRCLTWALTLAFLNVLAIQADASGRV